MRGEDKSQSSAGGGGLSAGGERHDDRARRVGEAPVAVMRLNNRRTLFQKFTRDQIKNMASYDSRTRFDRTVEGTF